MAMEYTKAFIPEEEKEFILQAQKELASDPAMCEDLILKMSESYIPDSMKHTYKDAKELSLLDNISLMQESI